jgi:hypothetical protein
MLDERLFLTKVGGFTRSDVLKMPIWEKRYYVEKLLQQNKKD